MLTSYPGLSGTASPAEESRVPNQGKYKASCAPHESMMLQHFTLTRPPGFAEKSFQSGKRGQERIA
jgi:hypothetical protein